MDIVLVVDCREAKVWFGRIGHLDGCVFLFTAVTDGGENLILFEQSL